MYNEVLSNIRTCDGLTSNFYITIGLHQEFVSSPPVFAMVMYENRATSDEIPWFMLFSWWDKEG